MLGDGEHARNVRRVLSREQWRDYYRAVWEYYATCIYLHSSADMYSTPLPYENPYSQK